MVYYILVPLTAVGMVFAMMFPRSPIWVKAAASALFVTGAAIAASQCFGRYAALILTALVLGAIGDVFLGLHIKNKKLRIAALALGGICFLGGHVVFLVLFLGLEPLRLWLLFVPALFFAAPWLFSKKIGARLGTAAVAALAVYAAALGLFLAALINLLIAAPSAKTALMLAAGVLFCASDMCLLAENLRARGNGKPYTYTIMYCVAAFYYAAQWIFVYTILL